MFRTSLRYESTLSCERVAFIHVCACSDRHSCVRMLRPPFTYAHAQISVSEPPSFRMGRGLLASGRMLRAPSGRDRRAEAENDPFCPTAGSAPLWVSPTGAHGHVNGNLGEGVAHIDTFGVNQEAAMVYPRAAPSPR